MLCLWNIQTNECIFAGKLIFPVIFSSFQYHICVYSAGVEWFKRKHSPLSHTKNPGSLSCQLYTPCRRSTRLFAPLMNSSYDPGHHRTIANRTWVPVPVSQLWGKCIGAGEGGAWIFQSKRLTFILHLTSKDRFLSALERQVQGEYTRSYSICGCIEIFMWCSISASNEQQPPRVCDLANLDSVLAIISQGGWRVAGGWGL